MAILAIDAGTTGITALVISAHGKPEARAYCEFEQHYPKPGTNEISRSRKTIPRLLIM